MKFNRTEVEQGDCWVKCTCLIQAVYIYSAGVCYIL